MNFPPPADLTFFLDRGLGSLIVADALRDSGWQLETMDERYGKNTSQRIQDTQWIQEATTNGDVLLCKDLEIASNPLEARCVYMTGARVFGLANRRVKGREMARTFLDHAVGIFDMALGAKGPYVVSVSGHSLRRCKLKYP